MYWPRNLHKIKQPEPHNTSLILAYFLPNIKTFRVSKLHPQKTKAAQDKRKSTDG